MLKTTYKPAAPPSSQPQQPPLRAGWTAHKAPTGHTYYYNTETRESTYVRPTILLPNPFLTETPQGQSTVTSQRPYGADHNDLSRHWASFQGNSIRRQPQDRPKKRKVIPECEPWVLVTTKLGRRFVHNPETNKSFWKFPQDVLLATFKMDRLEQEEKEEQARTRSRTDSTADPTGPTGLISSAAAKGTDQDLPEIEESDSFDEVEVTDDEDTKLDRLDSHERPLKKQHTEPSGPVDFNEEDIAYQLAQMGQDYGLDPGEYGNGEAEEYDTGLPLSLEDSRALFHNLLSDFAINPYTTWEKIVEDGHIIEDDRYLALPNSRARKEAFTSWSTEKIQELKAKRAKEEKQDPRIPYLKLLHEHASPKLYWPEFKRKYRKENAMKDASLADRDRERIYRDHINRLKLPESTRKSNLKELLKTLPLPQLHRESTIDTLPSAILTDLRSISLPDRTRDALIEAYISTLPTFTSSSQAQD